MSKAAVNIVNMHITYENQKSLFGFIIVLIKSLQWNQVMWRRQLFEWETICVREAEAFGTKEAVWRLLNAMNGNVVYLI